MFGDGCFRDEFVVSGIVFYSIRFWSIESGRSRGCFLRLLGSTILNSGAAEDEMLEGSKGVFE